MIRIELPVLIEKLNSQTKLALEQAAALCISRGNSEVTFEHLLFTLLDNPLSDVRELIKLSGLEHDAIKLICGDSLPKE
ncbi:Clp protease N-terminal domain-containing protein, partial [Photobacterium damselae]